MNSVPITMAVRSKAWVYGSSLTGTAGSNPNVYRLILMDAVIC